MGTKQSDAAWRPALSTEGPRYRALADAIAEAVADGALSPGDRLPPVRELAWDLNVTPGTVSRAYQMAETRGLLEGQVGRGTFVKAPAGAPTADGGPADIWEPAASDEDAPPQIDLRVNFAIDVGQEQTITEAMLRLIGRVGAMPLARYHRYGEDADERDAAADWLAGGGLPRRPADTLLCSGAQHGLLTALAATLGGRDAVALTEPLVHPGLKDCARVLGARLEPVAADPTLGLDPDALDEAAARLRPGAIILSANAQNPTLANMPLARREAIAEIARRRRIPVIEDDVYGWTLGPRLPSFPSLIPELSWYVSSLSKCVAAGLRAGFILCPKGEGPRAARLMQGHTQHISWLISALAAELIRSGEAAKIVARVAEASTQAGGDLRRLLAPRVADAGGALTLLEGSTVGWLELPEPWRASDFFTAAQQEGVRVSPSETFVVGRAPAPQAVRIAFGAIDRAATIAGAARMAKLLKVGPPPTSMA